jgi:hypothetical protein
MNEYDLIYQSVELFSLRKNGENSWMGLLCPAADGNVGSYSRPSLALILRIDVDAEGKHAVFCCIKSIDDSGVSIFGPKESLDKAKHRLDDMKKEIEDSWNYILPDLSVVKLFCIKQGVHPDWW